MEEKLKTDLPETNFDQIEDRPKAPIKESTITTLIEAAEKQNETETPVPEEVHISEVTVSERYNDIYKEYRPDVIVNFSLDKGLFFFQTQNNIVLKIEVLSPRIFRFRYSVNGIFERDFSYAIDDKFQAEKVDPHFEYKGDFYAISTKKMTCRISKEGMKLNILNKKGEVICEDASGFYAKWTILKGLKNVQVSKVASPTEQYFGLGDKSCAMNLRGEKLENWCTDAFGYEKEDDPLYRAIPFYYGLNKGKGYGIFFDNTYKTHFDFDSDKKGEMTFSADGGEMNYYFIYGPQLLEVARQYTDLTGRPELPPLWALGFHQCRWSYYPESRVWEVAAEFRERKIPCDALYLDIDYMDGYRCFTWDDNHFPNPTQMIADLKAQGFETVVMIDPGLKEDPNYWVYRDGLEKGMFCKRTNGEMMVGPVWPAECVFPDFTNPKVREWWKGLYKDLYVKNGVSGFWNDMNEPAVFKVNHKTFPDNVLHHYDGDRTDHRKAHNIYGQQMSKSTYEGLKMLQPQKRPLVITRATFSGGQRYACVWTGDNIASWEHLRLANIQCQRLSLSGFSHVGTDIGGFVESPKGELMVRWLQLGIFHPLYRVHSMGNNVDGAAETEKEEVEKQMAIDRLDQEPWSFGDSYTPLAKSAIELRYQLLAYIYTTYWKYVQDGTPMLSNLSFYNQTDEQAIGREKEFLFGEHLLVSPVLQSKKESKTTTVYLPKGEWYYFWSAQLYEGQQQIKLKSKLHEIPFFVKAGTILPLYPIRQYTAEKPVDVLTLEVYYKEGTANTQLYEDAGEGYDYVNGGYSLKTFSLEGSEHTLVIQQHKEGNFKDTYATCLVKVYGLPFDSIDCFVDEEEVAATWDEKQEELTFQVKNAFKTIEIREI